MRVYCFILLMLISSIGLSQPTDVILKNTASKLPNEKMALQRFLQSNIQYPDLARENSIEGCVTVLVHLNSSEKNCTTKVINGIGYGCDEEAVRLIKLLCKLRPSLLEDQPSKTDVIMNIIFKLR